MKTLCMFAFALLFVSCSHKKETHKTVSLPKTLDEAIASPMRTPENAKRDIYRHPKETLEFFGLKPNMTVVEITPGAGWYTEILFPYLVMDGKYIMAAPELTASSPEYAKVNDQKVKAILDKYSDIKDKAVIAPFDPLNRDITEPGTADMVVTFRNVHNWIGNQSAEASFKAFYRALKPGGILGVTDHLGKGKKVDFKSGYMTEREVMDLAKKAGFKFVARSKINLNPKDSTKHPEGVWTLPPVLRQGEKDRAKYEAIGESNRMTLKFIKPQK